MSEPRRLITKRLIQKNLSRSVVEMVIAADHMRDAHQGIVHDRAEIVGRHAVRPQDDQIVQLRIVEAHCSLDQIVHHRLT